MPFEEIQVTNSFADEHRSDELTGIMPLIAVGSEDAITQKWFPFFMESFALAVISELGCQDRFDVLWISSKERSCVAQEKD
jgi:hypothetical protein